MYPVVRLKEEMLLYSSNKNSHSHI